MQLIDEIMVSIADYVTDEFAVSNALYVILSGYNVEKATTDIVPYRTETNEILIKRFIVAKKIKGCTDRTLKFYAKQLTVILAKIGKNAAEVTADDMRYHIAVQIKRGLSKETINNDIRVMRSFYQWMTDEDIVAKNPMNKISAIKREYKPKEAFTDDEIVRMRSLLTTNRERAIFELFLCTGCRVSELVGIRVDDVDVEEERILVHGKGQKDRHVYLNANAKFALLEYSKERKDRNVWLFPGGSYNAIVQSGMGSKHDGKNWYKVPELVDPDNHIDKVTIEQMIRRLGKKCGVKAYPHKFRRTCATNALRTGMPIEMVSKMLGHANIAVTQLYLDLKEEDLKNMHKKYVR